jgi:glycosyltransferase involved in cell wall biosynthesis
MSNPEFTIIIPVRNGANYIGAAISSILSQSYPHFRIMILENGSTDTTIQIVNAFADDRISIIPSTSSLNIEENWSRIRDLDLMEYLTILGHDDILYPEFLAEIVELITAEPSASLYQVQFEYIDSNGDFVRHIPKITYKETASQFLAAVMDDKEECCGTGYVMRSKDYRQVGGIPAYPGLLYADVVLWYRLSNLSYKVCSPKTLVGYRVHPQNMHRNANFSRYYSATRQYYDFLRTSTDLKDKPEVAHTYINQQLQLSYRIAVVQAILAPNEGRIQLQTAKREITEDGLFTLYDRPARVYEAIPPLPSWLRQIVLLPIIWRRVLRRFLASH